MNKLLTTILVSIFAASVSFAQNVGPRYVSVMYDTTGNRVYPNAFANQITNNPTIDAIKALIAELQEAVGLQAGAELAIVSHDWSELDDSGIAPAEGFVMDFSEAKQQAFTCFDPPEEEFITYTLVMPPADPAKIGFATVYIDELPSDGFRYNISELNIAPSTYPFVGELPPWLGSENDAVWKCEFESVRGSTQWYYVKSTEYILEQN